MTQETQSEIVARLRAWKADEVEAAQLEISNISDEQEDLLTEAADLIQSQSSALQRLEEALTGLVTKLDECRDAINYASLRAYGENYQGPQYGEALKAAREALAS